VSGNPRKSGKHSSLRFLKAYGTTIAILAHYVWLLIIGRFLSQRAIDERFRLEHKRTGARIVKSLLDLKGIYIKLGQTVSIMSNFLPPEFTEGFESLQDAVPPHPFEDVEERFQKDFGKTADQLFASIERVPIASASLGQVHVAYAKTGEKLAVKIQYPDIDAITKQDLKTIRHIFWLVDLIFPNYNLMSVYSEAAKVIMLELDYTCEAGNIAKLSANFKDSTRFVFPTVHPELSSAKVLTTSFIDGAKVTDLKKLQSYGVDIPALARELIEFYCKQIFQDGFYHADPHPGNIIITPDGRIAMVDFGAVAEVSAAMRSGMTLFVEGLIKKDTKVLGNALKQMGFIAKDDAEDTLDRVVEYFYSKISSLKIENFNNLNFTQFHQLNDLVELRKMDVSIRDLTSLFLIPKDWILLERTMLLMMGLTAQLDDKLNPVEIVIPYVETFLLGKDRSMKDLLISASKDLILAYVGLPGELNKTLKKINAGQISMNLPDVKRELAGIKRGMVLLGSTILATASGILCYFLYRAGLNPIAFRFEMSFYAFSLIFGYFLVKR
jgi:ubiquinone biosynthesis protein